MLARGIAESHAETRSVCVRIGQIKHSAAVYFVCARFAQVDGVVFQYCLDVHDSVGRITHQ